MFVYTKGKVDVPDKILTYQFGKDQQRIAKTWPAGNCQSIVQSMGIPFDLLYVHAKSG